MCSDHAAACHNGNEENKDDPLAPPAYDQLDRIALPPDHILAHYAHCHPTDLEHETGVYDAVQLGGLAAMATVVDDQGKVDDLGGARGWARSDAAGSSSRVRVVNCFGYHPWFVHRYCLAPTTKAEHYQSIFFGGREPNEGQATLLSTLLPHLPDPVELGPLLDRLRADMSASLAAGRLTMLGEVGLDGQARVRWPVSARKHWAAYRRDKRGAGHGDQDDDAGQDEGDDWKRLTPFKTSMAHQRAVLDAQLELAIELGVNVSLHCVSASGATVDTLTRLRDTHGARFTHAVNVDVHSVGGLSPASVSQIQRSLANVYFSPSALVTARAGHAGASVQAIDPDRMLVESDSHDVRLCARLVWAAAGWISRCKGWRLEGVDGEPADWAWEMGGAGDDDDVEFWDAKGHLRPRTDAETWTVRTLERNWARFMRLVD